jgi:hypothetical protein
MRVIAAVLTFLTIQSASAADGAWVAFYREGNTSMAFERTSIGNGKVNLLSVSPKSTHEGLVLSWDIKTQIHQFDCQNRSYRILDRKILDQSGKQTSDETQIVSAMNNAFKDRAHPADSDALRKAHSLVCAKAEPAPAKPFGSLSEALSWMAN